MSVLISSTISKNREIRTNKTMKMEAFFILVIYYCHPAGSLNNGYYAIIKI